MLCRPSHWYLVSIVYLENRIERCCEHWWTDRQTDREGGGNAREMKKVREWIRTFLKSDCVKEATQNVWKKKEIFCLRLKVSKRWKKRSKIRDGTKVKTNQKYKTLKALRLRRMEVYRAFLPNVCLRSCYINAISEHLAHAESHEIFRNKESNINLWSTHHLLSQLGKFWIDLTH